MEPPVCFPGCARSWLQDRVRCISCVVNRAPPRSTYVGVCGLLSLSSLHELEKEAYAPLDYPTQFLLQWCPLFTLIALRLFSAEERTKSLAIACTICFFIPLHLICAKSTTQRSKSSWDLWEPSSAIRLRGRCLCKPVNILRVPRTEAFAVKRRSRRSNNPPIDPCDINDPEDKSSAADVDHVDGTDHLETQNCEARTMGKRWKALFLWLPLYYI